MFGVKQKYLLSDGAKDEMLNNFLRPENRFAKADRMEEFLEMTSLSDKIVVPTFEVFLYKQPRRLHDE